MTRVLVQSRKLLQKQRLADVNMNAGVFSGELETHLAHHAHSCIVVLQVCVTCFTYTISILRPRQSENKIIAESSC